MRYKVYVRIDNQNRILEINSNEFIADIGEWLQIEEGEGDKYHHSQSNYLSEPIMDKQFRYNYKLSDGLATLRTDEEKQSDRSVIPAPHPGLEERTAATEMAIMVLMGGM